MEIHRSYYYYQEKRDDTEVEEAIRTAAQYGDGFWKIFKRLRREGKNWSHKKVYRVYKNMHYEKRDKVAVSQEVSMSASENNRHPAKMHRNNTAVVFFSRHIWSFPTFFRNLTDRTAPDIRHSGNRFGRLCLNLKNRDNR